MLADYQPQDDVWVFLDPAGHPFCLFLPSWPVRLGRARAPRAEPEAFIIRPGRP